MATWQPVIGLEIHARLMTRSKMFCPCATDFGAPPNSQVCPVCLGYPGALPVLNGQAVTLAIRMALATGSTVHERSVFARKNYFYADLPKGYQISQFDQPLATEGGIEVGGKRIRIQRIHLEEDAGKLIHREEGTLVDLNRAGTPLIEIVSEPDLTSAAEAALYFETIRQLLMYVDACDGNMEEGSLRCDANVSLHRRGDPLGTRAEIKNLNSFRYLARAVEFELERQSALLDSGARVVQETRLFDPAANETRPMRSKEEAHDYRYFDEPDLPPLDVTGAWIDEIRTTLPELPSLRSNRYVREWQIPPADAAALAVTRQLAEYFESVVASAGNPRLAANWVRNEVLRVLNETGTPLAGYAVTPQMLGQLIQLVQSGAVGGKSAKDVFEEMSASGESPESIVERRGLGQISDPDIIREAAARVVRANAPQVAQYRAGKPQLFGFFVGQLMKETAGKANAELANSILREMLDGTDPA